MKFGSGIIVVKKGTTRVTEQEEILHFCGWENKITTKKQWKESKDQLYKELETDPEFKLDIPLDECIFVKCPQELLDFYNEHFEGIDE